MRRSRIAVGGRFGEHLTSLFEKVSIWRRLSLLPGNFRPEAILWLLDGHPVTNQMLASVCPRASPWPPADFPLLAECWLPGVYKHTFCGASPWQAWPQRVRLASQNMIKTAQQRPSAVRESKPCVTGTTGRKRGERNF